MACKLCEEFRKKYPLQEHEGYHRTTELFHKIDDKIFMSPIACAFEHDNIFTPDNWACETMMKLRDIADYCRRYNDESIAVIPIPDNDKYLGFIVMTWYKDRGRTGQSWVMYDDEKSKLTLDIAEFVIKRYKK